MAELAAALHAQVPAPDRWTMWMMHLAGPPPRRVILIRIGGETPEGPKPILGLDTQIDPIEAHRNLPRHAAMIVQSILSNWRHVASEFRSG